jgi:ABC-type Fe3+-citrate transport system substrate-binding protein
MASATAIDSEDKRIVVLEISYLKDIDLNDGHITR